MRRFFPILLILALLTACESLPTGFQSDDADTTQSSLPEEEPMVPVGDEALMEDVEKEGKDAAEAPIDDSIDPEVRQQMAEAREKLDQGETAEPSKTADKGDSAESDIAEPEEPEDLWARLRDQFKLDLSVDNPRTRAQLKWYADHPAYIKRTVERARRYLYHILDEVERRDMPGELALLPVVESAFDPFAYSHGRAAGLWQFIPSTGRYFGLDQNWWYDGRRDVIAATDAALRYLQRLSDRFDGDWLLGLASYNSGAGTVNRAIRYNKRRNRDTDFWSLRLPRETRAYAPKLIAIAKLIEDPAKYGVTLPPLPDEPYFEVVKIDSQIDLAQAADLAGVDVEEIYLLNPAFNRWATAPTGPHRLLVPKDAAEKFRTALAELPPEKRLNWSNYTVKRGDTLIRIARRYGTTPDVIKDVNRLHGHMIRIGQNLLIPMASKGGDFYALSQQERLEQTQARFGGGGKAKVEYRVQSGDTLWDIAREYGVNHRKLARWNGMAPGDPLMPGKKLVIWTDNPPTVVAANSSSRKGMIRKIGYRVRSGDSLYLIANRFNVSVKDLVAWNGINPNRYLQPGQRLTLYVDIRRSP
ncbi:LysM peptidoglycan-binding domain-containing protein [Marinobacteraceae bacterium S3BR75-40.1]